MPGNAHILRLQGYCDGQARRLEQQRRDRALSPTAPKTRQAARRVEGWPLASSSREPSGGPMKPWRMAGRHLDVEPRYAASGETPAGVSGRGQRSAHLIL